jgi:dTDP-4-dehydrorhamnose reductase
MRLAVTGAGGMLGSWFATAASAHGHEVTRVTHRPSASGDLVVDLRDAQAAAAIVATGPEWIIHCAALTSVDWCESHPAETALVNGVVPGQLAGAAASAGIGLVYISTDSVFDGRRGEYVETDTPAPLNAYARAKADGEQRVGSALERHIIVRTGIYGWSPSGRHSLVEWILARLEAGDDVPGFTDAIFSPTSIADLSDVILELISREATGLWHAGSHDHCTKYSFARRVASAFGHDPDRVATASLADSPQAALRPRNTSLRSDRLEHLLGYQMPTVDDGVAHLRVTPRTLEQQPAGALGPAGARDLSRKEET